MENTIIVRIRSGEGQFRLNVDRKDTFGELLLEVRDGLC